MKEPSGLRGRRLLSWSQVRRVRGGVVGGAVYVEENMAALPVVVGAGSHSSSSDCIPADSDCFFSSIKWNPPGTDGIEIQLISFETIVSSDTVIKNCHYGNICIC